MLTSEQQAIIYKNYERMLLDDVFSKYLIPFTRFGVSYLNATVREVLSGTDRNRIIFKAKERKQKEAEFNKLPRKQKEDWTKLLRSKYILCVKRAVDVLREITLQSKADGEALRSLLLSRKIFDDGLEEFSKKSRCYLQFAIENAAARVDGDHFKLEAFDRAMREIEQELGVSRDCMWYVAINVHRLRNEIKTLTAGLTASYTRLLFKMASTYVGVTTVDENFSAGTGGLMRAVKNFDANERSTLANHAKWWIRSSIIYQQKRSSLINVPTNMWYRLGKLEKDKNKGENDANRDYRSKLKAQAALWQMTSIDTAYDSSETQDSHNFIETLNVSDVSDAEHFLGDSAKQQDWYKVHEQEMDDGRISEKVSSLMKHVDYGNVFNVVLWMLNKGTDANFVAGMFSDSIPQSAVEKERERQASIAA
jgi:DNA-directed RNA polymerase sigma subunit (sigma70/sigma32)